MSAERSEESNVKQPDAFREPMPAAQRPGAGGGVGPGDRGQGAVSDGDEGPRLSPEDQARVDAFVRSGVNSVERKPFRPLRLLFVLIAIVMGLSLFSQLLARWAGVY